MHIGLKNCSEDKRIRFSAYFVEVRNEKNEFFRLDDISWKDKDISVVD